MDLSSKGLRSSVVVAEVVCNCAQVRLRFLVVELIFECKLSKLVLSSIIGSKFARVNITDFSSFDKTLDVVFLSLLRLMLESESSGGDNSVVIENNI